MSIEVEQKIRERAYEIYRYRQEFDCKFTVDRLGHIREITEIDDWIEAEQEILGGV